MSVWSTRSHDRDRDYIIIKHSLPNVNNVVMGIKFRGGYCVVENNSKTYYQLKKVPYLQKAKEFPLIFLRKLPFITRSVDVKMIFGEDVYRVYIKKLEEALKAESLEARIEAEKKHIEESDLCTYRNTGKYSVNKNELCKRKRLPESPSYYCFGHLLQDPKLTIEIPMAMTNEDRRKLTLRVMNNIDKYLKSE